MCTVLHVILHDKLSVWVFFYHSITITTVWRNYIFVENVWKKKITRNASSSSNLVFTLSMTHLSPDCENNCFHKRTRDIITLLTICLFIKRVMYLSFETRYKCCSVELIVCFNFTQFKTLNSVDAFFFFFLKTFCSRVVMTLIEFSQLFRRAGRN